MFIRASWTSELSSQIGLFGLFKRSFYWQGILGDVVKNDYRLGFYGFDTTAELDGVVIY